jgi:hypothetical protein
MSDLSFDTLTIRVPLKLKRHGGRKLVIVPEGAGVPIRAKASPNDTLLKALARAHRWRRMLQDVPIEWKRQREGFTFPT